MSRKIDREEDVEDIDIDNMDDDLEFEVDDDLEGFWNEDEATDQEWEDDEDFNGEDFDDEDFDDEDFDDEDFDDDNEN
mgnify:CR=1 FL=1